MPAAIHRRRVLQRAGRLCYRGAGQLPGPVGVHGDWNGLHAEPMRAAGDGDVLPVVGPVYRWANGGAVFAADIAARNMDAGRDVRPGWVWRAARAGQVLLILRDVSG